MTMQPLGTQCYASSDFHVVHALITIFKLVNLVVCWHLLHFALCFFIVTVVTVNDYLAQRDSEWMGRVHRFLGLSVGLIQVISCS